MEPLLATERSSYIPHKGHEFVHTLYHFPSSCEACPRPLWHVFKPPPALECRRCRVKCHKDHIDRKEEVLAPCRGQEVTLIISTDNLSLNNIMLNNFVESLFKHEVLNIPTVYFGLKLTCFVWPFFFLSSEL